MTRALHRRLDAIAARLPKDRMKDLERRASEAAVARRVEGWIADSKDFEVLMAPTIEDERQALIDEAVTHRVHRWNWGPTPEGEWRPHLLAAAVVDHDPEDHEHQTALATLEEIARPGTDDSWQEQNPWDSNWFEANCYLVALGNDHGASLHAAAAPAMAAARASWLEHRDELASLIRRGLAHRLQFSFWVNPNLEERRQQLLIQACARRAARHGGAPLEIEDVRDVAADVASYFPGEPVPEDHAWILRIAREQQPTPGTPGHEEWVQANELHWVLGPDGGKQMRLRLEAMLGEDTPVTS